VNNKMKEDELRIISEHLDTLKIYDCELRAAFTLGYMMRKDEYASGSRVPLDAIGKPAGVTDAEWMRNRDPNDKWLRPNPEKLSS
jgi:hypothetical protein